MSNQLIFNNAPVQSINRNNQIWITSSELAKLLQYKSADSITKIYNRNKSEFTPKMTEKVKLTAPNNLIQTVRIFSLRGAHLIAMFARTPVAEAFRTWVLDILDKEVSETTPIVVKPNREILPKGIYHCRSKYNPYRACVWNGNDMIHVGVFSTIAEAVDAQKKFTTTGEIKQIQKTRASKTKAKLLSVPDTFTKEDIFAHISMFLETAQLLGFYPHGKSLSLDLIEFVQEEALRQSH
jgi:prophage antirepressor-like protein